MTDGVLVVDKPAGVTSHDVVAVARRVLGQPHIGHTGTLDPMATGVLPLACGRATRLVRFLAASDKDYEADIRLGVATDTYDITGREVSRSDARPAPDAVAAALEAIGRQPLQTPPPFSAKKIDGRRAYDLARAAMPVRPEPVSVSVRRLQLVSLVDGVATVRLACSAGFYVRSLAHDLGVALGTGACLQALRRTRSGDFGLHDAVGLDLLAGGEPEALRRRIVPLERLLPALPAVRLTEEGRGRVSHGREVGPDQAVDPLPQGPWVRMLGPDGALLALGTPAARPGALHPSVVLI